MRTFTLPLQAQGSDPYATGDLDGFEGLGEGSQDYFSVSRQPRPGMIGGSDHAQSPPRGSPQDIIDSFHGRYGPRTLTPEEEAELINRLRAAQQ